MIGKLVIVLLTVCSSAIVWAERINYCDPSLCKNNGGAKHVACSSYTGFDSYACGNQVKEIPLDGALQDLILDLHNKARNTVAEGGLNKYGGCDRMIEMTYDETLAYIAGFNSRKCKMVHDECRNTYDYPFSGQNIAITWSSPKCYDTKSIITGMFNRWFDEYKSCGLSSIKSYSSGGPVIGHFTQIANNKASKVGCSLVQWIQDGDTCYTYLVCNYALTNMIDEPIFTTGKAGSKCQAGLSAKYPGLCSAEESVLWKPVPYSVSGESPNTQSTSSTTYTSNGNGNSKTTVKKTTYTYSGSSPNSSSQKSSYNTFLF